MSGFIVLPLFTFKHAAAFLLRGGCFAFVLMALFCQTAQAQTDPLAAQPAVDIQVNQTSAPQVEAPQDPAMNDLLEQIDTTAPPSPEVTSSTADAGVPAVEATVVEQAEGLLPPPSEQLNAPQPASSPESTSPAAPNIVPQTVGAVPALPAEQAIDENVFFDAETLVPEGEMVDVGPIKVDPETQPASKLIIVRENHSANSRQAQLVSADRAIQLGRYESALVIYEKLLLANPNDQDAKVGRAVSLQHVGRSEEAISAYEQILDKRPGNVDARVNMLGLVGSRYPASALAQLGELLQSNPSDTRILSQMAIIQADVGQYNEALQSLGIVAGLEPTNAVHLFNIAVIADRAGKKKEAIKYYEEALDKDTIYGGSRTIPRDTVFERLAQLR